MESIISILLAIFGIYLILGFLFAIIFLLKGITTVDPNTKGSSLFFKILIFPGLCLLWVFMLSKWMNIIRSWNPHTESSIFKFGWPLPWSTSYL